MPPLSQANLTADTPMGAALIVGGATFKVWAPSAAAVYLNGVFGVVADWTTSASPNLAHARRRRLLVGGFSRASPTATSTSSGSWGRPAEARGTSAIRTPAS
jgi:hypothetical protein